MLDRRKTYTDILKANVDVSIVLTLLVSTDKAFNAAFELSKDMITDYYSDRKDDYAIIPNHGTTILESLFAMELSIDEVDIICIYDGSLDYANDIHLLKFMSKKLIEKDGVTFGDVRGCSFRTPPYFRELHIDGIVDRWSWVEQRERKREDEGSELRLELVVGAGSKPQDLECLESYRSNALGVKDIEMGSLQVSFGLGISIDVCLFRAKAKIEDVSYITLCKLCPCYVMSKLFLITHGWTIEKNEGASDWSIDWLMATRPNPKV